MHFRTRTWVIISLSCFLAATFFWQLGERLDARAKANAQRRGTNGSSGASKPGSTETPSAIPPGTSPAAAPGTARTNSASALATNLFPHQLTNSRRGLQELLSADEAILLRNALIDSTSPTPLSIPAHLRASGEPGAYVVQARGPITDAFRARLTAASAEIVSYVPNNAYLVRASSGAAQQLKALPETLAVLPWEPYFKLDPVLLGLAVDQKPLPSGALNLLLLPGERTAAQAAFDRLGVTVTTEQSSPFGPFLSVLAPTDRLVELAALPSVQTIERQFTRGSANDLTRARLKVAVSASTVTNYLDLSGAGVIVGVNDTGIDAGHMDLIDRVYGFPVDTNGHGTHVAGIIASSGEHGPNGTNALGSVSNANFRGMAPAALLYSQLIDPVFGAVPTDTSLAEGAAAVDARIVNNSWGYIGDNDYNVASAIWDAAARDALTGVPGSQPLTLVFAAGNIGLVESGLFGLRGGTINAPGTAKNVITVGACENHRRVTNSVVINGNLSQPWLGLTDSSNQVAAFSAFGNVGRGLEGISGRFKPDVVAPGTFVVSCRSSDFQDPGGFGSLDIAVFPFQLLAPRTTNFYTVVVPPEGTTLYIEVLTNRFSPYPFPALPVHVRDGSPPDDTDFVDYNYALVNVMPGNTHYSVGNPNNFPVRYDLRRTLVLTNDTGDYFSQLEALNEKIGPYYRYESGTSQSAAAVSGMLALIQEYFTSRLSRTNSPALMKALVINGARSLGSLNAFEVGGAANLQGWGLVNVTNSITAINAADAGAGVASGPLLFIDQDASRALVTGQSVTRVITVNPAATNFPLRITLAWTDPPGNPAVGPKLVNDLDLIVTNLANGQVFIGNNFDGVFTPPSPTNVPLPMDNVNNVENIYINSFPTRLSPSYSVTVRARRVNVNAVTAQTNGIAQDYALVISTGNPAANALGVGAGASLYDPAPQVTTVTNGRPLLHQRVGANNPLSVSTNGIANQWHFFVVTNQLPNFNSDTNQTNMAVTGTASNIAFAVFQAPNLSWPRTNNADLDLYVSTNPAITNLDPAVIGTSFRSLGRGGTESVVLANVAEGTIYYAAVKSEDQQAGDFGFFAVSSDLPFSSQDTNSGNIIAQGYVLPAEIPDGSADDPQAALVFAFVTESVIIQNIVVTNQVTHGNLGDLQGILEHNQIFAVLNNLQANPPDYPGFIEWVFDDVNAGQDDFAVHTDPPGTLRNFIGEDGIGAWQLTMVDSSQFFTGRVDNLILSIEPRKDDLTNGVGIVRTIPPNGFFYTVVDVPVDATNLSVCVSTDYGPVEAFLKRGAFPGRTDNDAFGFIAPPGDCVSISKRDSPPLSAGRYFIGIFNPGAGPVTVRIRVIIERDLQRASAFSFRSGGAQGLLDDAITNSIIHVFRNQIIADVRVGVRLNHPRVSDLALHLVSPSGTRVLLAENRGGPDGADFGFGMPQLTVIPISTIGGPAQTNILLNLSSPDGTLEVDYDFFTIPDRMTIYYEGELLFDSGVVSGAGTYAVDFSGSSTNITIIMNEGGNDNSATAWTITAKILTGVTYANFTDDTNLARLPIKFEIPPFTNITYSITNYLTNATLVADGFEDGRTEPEFLYTPFGQYISGWLLTDGEVNTMGVGATNAPWMTAPYAGRRFLDINGDLLPGTIRTNFPTVPGLEYRVSYAYAQNPVNPSNTEAQVVILDQNGLPIKTVDVLAPAGNPGLWQTNLFNFSATSDTTLLDIASLTFGADTNASAGVFFDDVRVEQVTTVIQQGIYFQPEEPLTAFRGENAFGDWRLEIWDTRVGASLSNVLTAWRLNITFVNTNPPVIPLTNAMEYCGTIGTNEAAYFVIQVPLSASVATNTLMASDNVDLVYNGTGVPLVSPGDTNFLSNRPDGYTLLATNGWNSFDAAGTFIDVGPQRIRPGRRYYLAVRNRADTPTDYCVRVNFDRLDPDLLTIGILTNPCVTSTILATNQYDYYQFDAASNALALHFELSMLSGDLALVVKKGFPLPLYNFYYSQSDNFGTTDEVIDLYDFSGMVLPGRWYIGVYNPTQSDVSYQLCVSQITGEVTQLGTGGSETNTVGPFGVQYYKVNILPDACSAMFCAYPTNGDVNVYVAKDFLAPVNTVPTNTTLLSTNAGIVPDCVQVSAFSPTNQLTPGCWVMAVVNPTATAVSYRVEVTQETNCFSFTQLTNCVPLTNTITQAGGLEVYQVFVSNNVIQASFEVFGMNTNVDLYLKYATPVPIPGPGNFDYASTNSGTTNEYIVAVTNYPTLLQPGYWFLTVVNNSPSANAHYAVRVCMIEREDVIRLTQPTNVCGQLDPPNASMPNSGAQFFTFLAASNAIQVTFELHSLTNDVDLFVQRSPPLTNFTTYPGDASGYPYASTNRGATNEYICLSTNSAPAPLAGGLWFVTAVNRDTNGNPAHYCLRATQIRTSDFTRLSNGVAACDQSLGPTNAQVGSGVRYYTFAVATNAIAATFEAFNISSNGNVDIYVQREPCLTNFVNFDASTTNYPYASTNPGGANEWICVATNSAPVPLAAGDWIIAVVNRATNMATRYCIRASQLFDTNAVPLADGVMSCGPAPRDGSFATDYYVFNVSTAAVQVVFELFPQTNATADMFVSYGPCFPDFATFQPGPTNYPYSSLQPSNRMESVCVATNSTPVALTPGDWFAVVRRQGDYCIRATQLLSNDITVLANGVRTCNTVGTNGPGNVGVQFYRYPVSSNAVQATFEVTSTNGNVDAYLQYGLCLTNFSIHRGAVTNYPYLSTNIFTNTALVFYPYASTNLGTNTETICVVTNSLPVPLQGGDWYLAVVNRDTNNRPVDYCVRVLEVLDTEVTELVHRIPTGVRTLEPTNGITGSGIDYFHYRVATNAIQINLELFLLNGNADLYAQRGPCWMDPTQFPYASTNLGTNADRLFIATNSAPVPLAPGDWYFAVVHHDLIQAPLDYILRLTEFRETDVIRLANCVAYTNTAPPTNLVLGAFLDYYVYEVTTNSVETRLEVVPLTNDVNAYLRRELLLPRSDYFDYAGINSVLNPEYFLVNSNSAPTPLAPGLWFLAVENPSTLNATSTYYVRIVDVMAPGIVRLTNGIPYAATVEPTGFVTNKGVDYYVFHVSSNAVEAAFKVFNVDGDIDVFFMNGLPLPSSAQNVGGILFRGSGGQAADYYTYTTNGTPPLTPGDWYVAVYNRADHPVHYSVCVTEYVIGATGQGGIVRLANGVAYANTVQPRGAVPLMDRQFYVYTVSSNGVQADFETFGANGNVDLFLSHGVPLPDEFSPLASASSGTMNELIVLTTNSAPVALQAGDWYLAVVNRETSPVSYKARVTEYIIDDGSGTNGFVTRLLSSDCQSRTNAGTNVLGSPAIDYYVFSVTNGATRAYFELSGLSADLTLLVRRGLPLPGLTNYDAISANPGLCEEFISLSTNAASPVVLEPGNWFIAVVSTNATPANYTICAIQSDVGDDRLRISSISLVTNWLCVSWTNTLPGVFYHMQALTHLGSSNWVAFSPTIPGPAAGLESIWCTNRPDSFHYFRIKEGPGPKDLNTSVAFTCLECLSTGFHACWTGPAMQVYAVEWTPVLVPATWTTLTTVTSTTTNFEFTDPDAQCGVPGEVRFYRVLPVDP